VMMGLYLLGPIMSMLVSYIARLFINIKEKSFFILELPVYRAPRWKNVVITMVNKAKIFVFDAGKVIMIISLILWALSTYGPNEKMKNIEARYEQQIQQHPEQEAELSRLKNTELLQNSYAGILGRSIEPVIEPLGYDWKIGIGLIASFAAREVFVGTMGIVYSVGEADEESSPLREKMAEQRWPDGRKVYTPLVAISLMVFYVLACQCASTIAVVKRETNGWRWPLFMFGYMTVLAYVGALLVYQVGSSLSLGIN